MKTIDAYADCKECRGSGEIVDLVPTPFGAGMCNMYSICEDCYLRAVEEGLISDGDVVYIQPCEEDNDYFDRF